MRKPFLLAAALALAAGPALAQVGAPPGPPPGAAPPPQAAAPVPPPPPPGPRGPGMEGPGMMGGRMMPGEPPGPMRGWHRGPPPSRAASFHFQREDGEIHIHCAEGESTRACVDAAAVLLDRLVGAPPAR
ncbi:hypothetical protein EAH89_02890 [Roseomonas nepalensis]|uniref:Uncharacterized protein n=1 Tax=Muricoccus nepalensis TaxID=1854500 RepID=A0A502GEN4_9PROT|nr:hypothetical protein [Roseomonas nepalensis]TPG60344.1 hypothetical protein EAH89_02890 [Roseomonas nepalensis]